MFKINSKTAREGSVIEVSLTINKEEVEKRWQKAIKDLNNDVKVDGFRQGKIPENILIQKIGELAVVEEATRMALGDFYPRIMEDEKIKAIGSPQIVITKIARGADVECIIRTEVIPEIKLPDYKKIAKKIFSDKEKIEVGEKDVEEVINQIKKYRETVEKKETEKENTESKEIELTDDFVKTLGDFKNVEDFKSKIKENVTKEKEYRAKERSRLKVLEEIIKDSKIDVPNLLIENELDRMTQEFSHELSRAGTTFEEYKKRVNKKEEEIRTEWKEKAKERVKSELILIQIAQDENLKPDPAQVEVEAKHMQEHYPSAEKDRIIPFVEEMLSKEEVFKFLEKQG